MVARLLLRIVPAGVAVECLLCDRTIAVGPNDDELIAWAARHLELVHHLVELDDPLGDTGTPPLRC